MTSGRGFALTVGLLTGVWMGPACSSSPQHPQRLGDYDGGGGYVFDAGGAGGAAGGAGGGRDGGGEADVSTAGGGGVSEAGEASETGSPHCSDGQRDADETDVDCGGTSCPGCAPNKACLLNTDCASQHCNTASHICAAPSCTDLIKNQDETDVDCGGNVCGRCNDASLCLQNKDCKSSVCSGTPPRCQAPSCTDGVKNGDETDTDCGGSCPVKCNRGSGCSVDGDCTTGVCTNGICACPAGMILIPTLGGGSFCIDQYEVTYAEYTVFYDANPTPTSQIPQCTWNKTYTPTANWPALTGAEDYPVRDVDWCDAYAYCQKSGKRLCGKIGGGAGDFAAYADAGKSQWFDACSAQGNSVYPYGSPFDVTRCNGQGYQTDGDGGLLLGPLPGVRVFPLPTPNTCVGGSPNLFDMSGNLAEWTDECDAASGATDNCRVRGGAYDGLANDLRCDAPLTKPRNTTVDTIGFRCCLD